MVSSALSTIRSSVPCRTSDFGLGMGLIILEQIHAGVKTRDLIRVSVEHQRGLDGALAEAPFAEPQLAILRVSGMIAARIHVRVEPVRLRPIADPGRSGLRFGEAD